ncbi:MAG TPA: TIGR02444 family protein, partial [Alteromonas macleodii]|nr:TIGR02444 family protein [Alteromonas macleodii]
MPTPNIDSSAFWEYSVSRYTKSDMAPLALLLQDNHKV